jgi:citrate/tricarballylate utilization protein
MLLDKAYADAQRAMQVCNACRYCEGFCAVFPAMELRREFGAADLTYLANLCHNCRGCFYACQYAPPHPFGVNVPRAFAEVRSASYADFAWPRAFAGLFERNGTVLAIVTSLALALVLLLAALLQGPALLLGTHTQPGAFYAVIPAWAMLAVACASFGFSLLAMTISAFRFWRETRGSEIPPGRSRLAATATALRDVLTLQNLGGGGEGCNDRNEGFSQVRRKLHHALFYGFGLCFAATSVAAIYEHLLGRLAPYPMLSLPVVLGTVGGLGMLVGAGGLAVLKAVADREPAAPRMQTADSALLALLLGTAATGLLLLALRETPAMGILLAVHLGFVLALFALMPYSKFVHGIYRSLALWRAARERGTG